MRTSNRSTEYQSSGYIGPLGPVPVPVPVVSEPVPPTPVPAAPKPPPKPVPPGPSDELSSPPQAATRKQRVVNATILPMVSHYRAALRYLEERSRNQRLDG